MDKIVIIVFICSMLIGWISYLVYLYNINTAVKVNYKVRYEETSTKYIRLQRTLIDFLDKINSKFPGSTLKYITTGSSEEIKGEIKYKN